MKRIKYFLFLHSDPPPCPSSQELAFTFQVFQSLVIISEECQQSKPSEAVAWSLVTDTSWSERPFWGEELSDNYFISFRERVVILSGQIRSTSAVWMTGLAFGIGMELSARGSHTYLKDPLDSIWGKSWRHKRFLFTTASLRLRDICQLHPVYMLKQLNLFF